MKNVARKTLSIIMSIVLVVGLCPGLAYAANDLQAGEIQGSASGGGTSGAPSLSTQDGDMFTLDGTWGDLTWWLDTDGTLYIRGSGDMDYFEYGSEEAWHAEDCKEHTTAIVVEDGVTSISKYAFEDMGQVYSITIPEGVTTIDYGAFHYCTSLASIDLPASLSDIEIGALFGCGNLTSVNVANGNEVYHSDSYGALYKGTTLVYYPEGATATQFAIEEGTTRVEYNAFDNPYLERLSIPASVEEFDVFGFDVPALSAYEVANGNATLFADEQGVLYQHVSEGEEDDRLAGTKLVSYPMGKTVETYTVREGTTSLGDDSFSGYGSKHTGNIADSLKHVVLPDSLRSIGRNCFIDCLALQEMEIPAACTDIRTEFRGCVSLQHIHVDEGNSRYYSDDAGVLYDRIEKELVRFPIGSELSSYAVSPDVSRIAQDAFAYDEWEELYPNADDEGAEPVKPNLTRLVIPSSIEDVDSGAFDRSHFDMITVLSRNALLDSAIGSFLYSSPTIRGYSDSTAQAWASKNNLTFEAIEAPDFEIVGLEESYAYTGEAIAPSVTVKRNGAELSADDYAVLYGNNVKGSNALVLVVGKGDLAGYAAEAGFVIEGAPFDASENVDNVAVELPEGVDAIELIQNVDGSMAESYGEDGEIEYAWYSYDVRDKLPFGTKLVITYRDATRGTAAYEYREIERYDEEEDESYSIERFVNVEVADVDSDDLDDKSKFLSWDDVSFDENQDYESQWSEPGDYEALLRFGGKTATIPCRVVVGDIASIKVTLADGATSKEYVEQDYYQDCRLDVGDRITVTYTDSSLEPTVYEMLQDDPDYYWGKFEYMSGEQRDFNHDRYSIDSDQYNDGEIVWRAGVEGCFFTVSYMGKTCEVPVTITQNPVSSIEFSRDSDTVTMGPGGPKTEIGTDYLAPYIAAGSTLTIHYADGATAEFAYDADSQSFIDTASENQRDPIWLSEIGLGAIGSEFWRLGLNSYEVLYGGRRCDAGSFDLVRPSDDDAAQVESISFEPADSESRPYLQYEGVQGYEVVEAGAGSYFHYDDPWPQEGDRLTVSYSDGAEVTYAYVPYMENGRYSDHVYANVDDDDDYIVAQFGGGSSDDVVNYFADQESDHWTAGGNNYITVQYRGQECRVPVTVKPNTVSAIEVELPGGADAIEGMEDVDGWLTSNGATSFFYYSTSLPVGTKVTIAHTDGKSAVYELRETRVPSDAGDRTEGRYVNVEDEEDQLGEFFYEKVDDQFEGENGWGVGPHEFKIRYMGRETTVAYRVLPNPVSDIRYTPVEPYSVIENMGGDVEQEEGGSYFHYSYSPEFAVGDILVVVGEEGEKEYRYAENAERRTYEDGEIVWAGAFVNVADEDDVISGLLVDIDSYYVQQKSHWAAGNAQVTVTYQGRSCTVPVTVQPNNVASIEVQLAGGATKRTYVEWVDNSDGEYSACLTEGDRLIVHFADGTSATYENMSDWEEFERVEGADVPFESAYYSCKSDQEEPWEAGDSYQFTVEYMGRSCTVPVNVVESGVTAIEYTPASTVAHLHPNGDDEYVNVEWNSFAGSQLVVRYGDEAVSYRADDRSYEYVDVAGQRPPINADAVVVDSVDGEDWKIGENEMVASYAGETSKFSVKVEQRDAADYVDVEVIDDAGSNWTYIDSVGYYDETGQIKHVLKGSQAKVRVFRQSVAHEIISVTMRSASSERAVELTADEDGDYVIPGTIDENMTITVSTKLNATIDDATGVMSFEDPELADAYKLELDMGAGLTLDDVAGTENDSLDGLIRVANPNSTMGDGYDYYVWPGATCCLSLLSESDALLAKPQLDSPESGAIGRIESYQRGDGWRHYVTVSLTAPATLKLRLEGATAPAPVVSLSAVPDVGKIALSWSMSAEVSTTIYEVYRAVGDSDEFARVARIEGRDNRSYIDEDVMTGVTYRYYVKTVNKEGLASNPSMEATAVPKSDTTPPRVTQVTPKGGSVIGGSEKTISVKADDNVAVTGIELFLSSDSGETWVSLGSGSANPFAYSFDTTAYADGDVQVKAIARDGAGNESTPYTVTYRIDNIGPQKVGNLSAESTSTTVTLRWDDVPDQDLAYFAVEERNARGEFERVQKVTSTRGANLVGLAPATEYVYRVVAYDQCDNRGVESDEVTITTKEDTLAPVVTSLTPVAAHVKGKLNVSAVVQDDAGVASVAFQTSADGVIWEQIGEAVSYDKPAKSVTAKRQIDTDALDEGALYVRAVGTDEAGNVGDESQAAPFVQYVVDRTAPAVPQGVTTTPSAGRVEISWVQGAESDLAGYSVYRQQGDAEAVLVASDLTTLNYYDRAVEVGQTYSYSVCVADAAGNMSERSEAVSATVPNGTEPPVIVSCSPVDGSAVGPANAELSVLARDDVKLADVRATCSIDGGTAATIVEERNIGEFSKVVTGKLPIAEAQDGSTLTIRVVCTDVGGLASDAVELSYTVDKTAPSVTAVQASAGEECIEIAWTGGGESDLAGYRVYRAEDGGAYALIASRAPEEGTAYAYADRGAKPSTSYTYKVESLDYAGNTSDAVSEAVEFNVEPQVRPAIICDLVQEVNCEYLFDAYQSEADAGIASYLFDFGDGTQETSAIGAAVHRYGATGEYEFKLTVTDVDGRASEISRTVVVKEAELIGSVDVKVVNATGAPVADMPVYFDMANTLDNVKRTDGAGAVSFAAVAGAYEVGVYRDGFLPVKSTVVTHAGGEPTELVITVVEQPIVTGTFDVNRMTLDEIQAAGIDVSDPANQQIVHVAIHLTYGGVPFELSAYADQAGNVVKALPQLINTEFGSRWVKPAKVSWPSGTGGGGGGGGIGGGSGSFDPYTDVLALIDVPAEASYLKEFFDVKLHIMNNADTEYTLSNNVVDFDVPRGMTLMDSLTDCEGDHVSFGTLAGQESKTLNWILRGDEEGEYNLTASFSGVLDQFNVPVHANFETDEPVKVYGKSAMKIVAEINRSIAFDALYFNLGLENIGGADMYLPGINVENNVIQSWQNKLTVREIAGEDAGDADDGAGAGMGSGDEEYVKKTVPVTDLGMMLSNAEGYSHPISSKPAALAPGERITKKYVAYGAIEYNGVGYLWDAIYEAADAVGAQVEIRVTDMDLFGYEDAQEQVSYINNKAKSAFEYIFDAKNDNYYYVAQAVQNSLSLAKNVEVVGYNLGSLVFNLDFGVLTSDDKKEMTRQFVATMMNDESFVDQVDRTIDTKCLKAVKTYLGFMSSTLGTKYEVAESDLAAINNLMSDSAKMRKLASDFKVADPDTFLGRVCNMAYGAGATVPFGAAILDSYRKDDLYLEVGNAVTSEFKSAKKFTDHLETVFKAWNQSAEIKKDLMQISVAHDEALALVNMLLNNKALDSAMEDEIEDIKEGLETQFDTQVDLFAKELGKEVITSGLEYGVKKATGGLMKAFGYSPEGITTFSIVYSIAKSVFNGVDYLTGWGDDVSNIRKLYVATELSLALRSSVKTNPKDDGEANTTMRALKYLVKLRILGERAYVETIPQEFRDTALAAINERDDTSYSTLTTFYNKKCEEILKCRDVLFGTAGGFDDYASGIADVPAAPSVTLNMVDETATLASGAYATSELEYSYDGESWKSCASDTVSVNPGVNTRFLWARVKGAAGHPAGNVAKVAIPARPRIAGKVTAVRDGEGYAVSGLAPGTYAYALSGDEGQVLKGAPTFGVDENGEGFIESADKAAAVYIAATATETSFFSQTLKVSVKDSLANAAITVANADEIVYGTGTSPVFEVRIEGEKEPIAQQGNYLVSYFADEDCTEPVEKFIESPAGMYYARITGMGSRFAGSQVVGVEMKKASLAGAAVSAIPAQGYTGKEIEPTYTVTFGEKELDPDTDFTASYESNVDAGTAVVKLAGRGNFEGEASTTFAIVPAALDETMVSLEAASYVFDGAAKRPAVVVEFDGAVVGDANYTVGYADNVNVGTATVSIVGTGNLAGTVEKTFAIAKAQMSDVSVAPIPAQVYTGRAIEPAVAATLGGYALAQTDYSVEYAQNIEVTSAATATLTAKEGGNFTGAKSVTFEIAKPDASVKDLANARISFAAGRDITYDGTAKEPVANVELDGAPVDSSLLDFTYYNNVNAGVATVVATPKPATEGYAGSVSAEFAIAPADIRTCNAEIDDPDKGLRQFEYTGQPIAPKVLVTRGETELVQGADFTVEYADNVNVGAATCMIRGCGNYVGEKTANFTIVRPGEDAISVAFKAETGKYYYKAPGKYYYVSAPVAPRVDAAFGATALVANRDYTVFYAATDGSDAEGDVGSYIATVEFKGNFAGISKQVSFEILPSAIGYDEIVEGLPDLEQIKPSNTEAYEKTADIIADAARYFAKLDAKQRRLVPAATLLKLSQATDAYYALPDEGEDVDDPENPQENTLSASLGADDDAPVNVSGDVIAELQDEIESENENYELALGVEPKEEGDYSEYKTNEDDDITVVDVSLKIVDKDTKEDVADIDPELENKLRENLNRLMVNIPLPSNFVENQVARVVNIHTNSDGSVTVSAFGGIVSKLPLASKTYVKVPVDRLSSFVITVQQEKSWDDVTVGDLDPVIYDGREHEPTPEVVYDKGGVKLALVEGQDYEFEYDGNKEATAGDKKAKVVVKPTQTTTYKHSDASLLEKEFVIEPKPVSLAWPSSRLTYTGAEQSIEPQLTGIVSGDDVKVTLSGASATDAGEYTAKAIGLEGPDAENYKLEGTAVEHAWSIEKATDNAFAKVAGQDGSLIDAKPSIADWVEGAAASQPTGPQPKYGTVTYQYFDDAGVQLAGPPTKAGNYSVRAVVEESSSYNGAVSAATSFTVKAKQPGGSSGGGQQPGSGGASAAAGLPNGSTATVGGIDYQVSDNAAGAVVFKKAPKAKKSVTVPATVVIAGKTYNVVGIAKNAFKGTKVKTVTIKSTQLTKKSVKGCFKGAKKLKTVKVPKAKKKAYKKIFTKKVCGKKVKVK